jgi:hypothetical protein
LDSPNVKVYLQIATKYLENFNNQPGGNYWSAFTLLPDRKCTTKKGANDFVCSFFEAVLVQCPVSLFVSFRTLVQSIFYGQSLPPLWVSLTQQETILMQEQILLCIGKSRSIISQLT